MKLKGIWNRICFVGVKRKLASCGSHVLFERPFDLEGAKHISLGSNVRSKPRLHLAAIGSHNGLSFRPEVRIGDNVSINFDVHIACINRIEIGDGSLLASKVFITDHYHGDTTLESLRIPPSMRVLTSKGPVIIGKNVWIGEGTVILPGVTIGDHAVIGANAVVTKDVPAYSVAAGVPASVIRSYDIPGNSQGECEKV